MAFYFQKWGPPSRSGSVRVDGDLLGGLFFKLILYFENGTQYWIVQNAFGTKWGQNGMMKMILGVDEGYIESGVYGPTPDLDID